MEQEETQEGDNGREVHEMPSITAVEESCDVQMQPDVNTKRIVQPETSNTLIEKSDHPKEHFILIEENISEKKFLPERAKLEDVGRRKIMLSEITNDAMDKAVPHTLHIVDGSLLSGIRVESTFSDEEENDYSNRNPLQISGTTSRTKKYYEGDGDEDNWDEDENSEPLRSGKHINVGVSKCAENALLFEPNIVSKQSKTDGTISNQPHEIGNEKHITNDVKADNTVLQKLSQLSTNQGKADDRNEENVNDASKKPAKFILNLLRNKEPESSEDTWGPGSDNEKEGSVESDTSDKFYHDENLPVSMIVGSDDLEDTESHIRLPVESVAMDRERVHCEEIPKTVIDDIDVTSHSDKDDEDEEHGNLTVQEHVHHTVPKQVHGSLA